MKSYRFDYTKWVELLSIPRIPVNTLIFRIVILAREIRVGDLCFDGLLARVFLMLADVLETEFPQVKIADIKNKGEYRADTIAELFANHQDPIE